MSEFVVYLAGYLTGYLAGIYLDFVRNCIKTKIGSDIRSFCRHQAATAICLALEGPAGTAKPSEVLLYGSATNQVCTWATG